MSATLRHDRPDRDVGSTPRREPAQTPEGAWWRAARDSGIVLVRRPESSARWATARLLTVAVAVWWVGFATGFVIGRSTAPRAAAAAAAAAPPTPVTQPPRALLPAPVLGASTPALAAPHQESPISPGLTAAQVVAVQRAHVGRSRDCVHRARQSQPDLAGTARISVFIASTGRVRDALWTRAEPSQTRAVGCITDAVRRWRFPATGYAGDFLAVLRFDLRTGARPAP